MCSGCVFDILLFFVNELVQQSCKPQQKSKSMLLFFNHHDSLSLSLSLSLNPWSSQAHLYMVGMLWFMSDINQLSLPTPFHSVLVSVSVFMALPIVFHYINSPDNSPFCHSVLPVLSLPYWSFQLYISVKVSFSPDIISILGSKHQLTNLLT